MIKLSLDPFILGPLSSEARSRWIEFISFYIEALGAEEDDEALAESATAKAIELLEKDVSILVFARILDNLDQLSGQIVGFIKEGLDLEGIAERTINMIERIHQVGISSQQPKVHRLEAHQS